MSGRLACRFTASWEEGHEAVRESFHRAVDAAADAGTEPPEPPAEVLRVARERSGDASDELSSVLRLARSRQLPSLYDPDGMSFPDTTPIYLDHGGIEVGRGRVVERTGDRFEFVGWVHPDHAAAVQERGHVSPGLFIDAATIEDVGGTAVLSVSGSSLVELSATAEPARSGTVVQVGPPRWVPSPDWEALLVHGSAFAMDGAPAGERFATAGPKETDMPQPIALEFSRVLSASEDAIARAVAGPVWTAGYEAGWKAAREALVRTAMELVTQATAEVAAAGPVAAALLLQAPAVTVNVPAQRATKKRVVREGGQITQIIEEPVDPVEA